MNRKFITLLALYSMPLLAMAADPVDHQVPSKFVDGSDITIEDLAHSFFFNYSGSRSVLEQIISLEGVNKMRPEIATRQREVDDVRALALKLRRLCGELQGTRTGSEFAATLTNNEQREWNEQREAARRVLSKLDDDDRIILQDYLDTKYRAGFVRTNPDYVAAFASGPFPSDQTAAITLRTCNGATQAEEKVNQ